MFIELAEFLRCPEPHPQAHCVVLPQRMVERDVVEGVVGCPACQREYPIIGGVVRFGRPPGLPTPAPLPDAGDVAALLGVTTPGGSVVLVGSAVQLVASLAPVLEGVHFVGVNGPLEAESGARRSLLEAASVIPLRDAMARGVVLGAECAVEPWIAEGARILLPGLRLVALREDVECEGIEQITRGQGMWVGQKRVSGKP